MRSTRRFARSITCLEHRRLATTSAVTDGDPTRLVGTLIEARYEVVSILGRGGNGIVCEVVDRSTKRSAALKMLVGEDRTLAARLEREGKALGLLSHPNIVALVGTGTLASG